MVLYIFCDVTDLDHPLNSLIQRGWPKIRSLHYFLSRFLKLGHVHNGGRGEKGIKKRKKTHTLNPWTKCLSSPLSSQCPFPQAQPQVWGTGTIPHGSMAEIVFRCLRVVISLLIEIKPNYLMWSWCWFDFWNQDIFLNWIWKHCRTKAPTVLPQFSTTVDHLTNSSKKWKIKHLSFQVNFTRNHLNFISLTFYVRIIKSTT